MLSYNNYFKLLIITFLLQKIGEIGEKLPFYHINITLLLFRLSKNPEQSVIKK
jgi:hypothetical protein